MNATANDTQTKTEALAQGEVEVPARIVSHNGDYVKIEYDWNGGVTETIGVEDINRYPLLNEDMSLGTETLNLHGDGWSSRWSEWTAPVAPTAEGSYKVNTFEDEIVIRCDLPWGEERETLPLNSPNAKMISGVEDGEGTIRWVGGWYPDAMFDDGYWGIAKKVFVKRGSYDSGGLSGPSTSHYVEANLTMDVLEENHKQDSREKFGKGGGKSLMENLRARGLDPTSDKTYGMWRSVSETSKPEETIRVSPKPDGWKLTWQRTIPGVFEWALGNLAKISAVTFLIGLLVSFFILVPLEEWFGVSTPEILPLFTFLTFGICIASVILWYPIKALRR